VARIRRGSPEPAIKRLLWEVRRLRATVLRSNDLVRAVDRFNGQSKLDQESVLALTRLREAVKDEPVVREDEARRLG